jgi:hypothetical protein
MNILLARRKILICFPTIRLVNAYDLCDNAISFL